MQPVLKPSAQRVKNYLAEFGCDFDVKELPASTRTAIDAAQTIGCTVAQIAKSLVFVNEANDRPVLLIVSGTNRVSVDKVEASTGMKLAMADGKFVKKRIGFAIGGVPPVAHLESVTTILDPDLKQHGKIWAAAGTPNAVFALTPGELDKLTQGAWVELAE